MARPNLPLPALTREFADRIAELPDEVKAAWEKPRPTANSRVYAVHQIAQGIVYDGASIRHWIEQRWPGEAEVFRERLESLRRAITGGSVREKADAILCSLEPDFDHLKLLAELLPKYLRELAGEMEAEPKPAELPYTLTPPNLFRWLDGEEVTLSPLEWKLLAYCLEHRQATVDDVIDAVWGHDSNKTDQDLHVLKSKLSNKLIDAKPPVPVNMEVPRSSGYLVTTIVPE